MPVLHGQSKCFFVPKSLEQTQKNTSVQSHDLCTTSPIVYIYVKGVHENGQNGRRRGTKTEHLPVQWRVVTHLTELFHAILGDSLFFTLKLFLPVHSMKFEHTHGAQQRSIKTMVIY